MSTSSLLRRLPRASCSRLVSSPARSFSSSPSSPSPAPSSPLEQASSIQKTQQPSEKMSRFYPWSVDPTLPVGDLFTAEGIKAVAVDFHQSMLERLNLNTQASDLETASVLDVVKASAKHSIPDTRFVDRDPYTKYWRIRGRKMFETGCQLLNNNFFLSTLRDPRKPGSYPYQLEKQVIASFGSSTGLEQTLLGTAEGLSSSAWIWLVQEERNSPDALSLITTYGPGTLLVHEAQPVSSFANLGLTATGGYIYGEKAHGPAVASMRQRDVASREAALGESSGSQAAMPFGNGLGQGYGRAGQSNASPSMGRHELSQFRRIVPLACISMQEHAYMVDHGVWGKQDYIKAWLRAVDWEVVESRMFYKGEGEGRTQQIVDTSVGKDWNQ